MVSATQIAQLRVLILGGTSEGAQLAARLSGRANLSVISSLAGRVVDLKLPEGEVRVGGFGGVDGLASYLVNEKIAVVIDVTHPYAARISQHAEIACRRTGLPLIALDRPPWNRLDGDRWHEVDDFQSAAKFVDREKTRVFLSIGRQELASFSVCSNAWFLIRAIEKPTEQLPPHHQLVLQRGAFALEDELKLLRDHAIDYVVSKNSGGLATYNKIAAARSLNTPVVLVRRPFKHNIETFQTVEGVVATLDRLIRDTCASENLASGIE
ncbi:cobalt-precorrin-6A reductase [Tunturiibacter lichenicola]|uniref:cobalt-precorrin-6A reductase n=1 Tax=Tunturiibacter lichenicola TaxID=2051959 RepID=UPI0021B28049|nr:cobalt-precorrin-6A reductase [Edaphobacter lichenicola]